MHITDADREAAQSLRIELADLSGFWHSPGDDGPLCASLARHRIEAEARILASIERPLTIAARAIDDFDPSIAPWELRARSVRSSARSRPCIEQRRTESL